MKYLDLPDYKIPDVDSTSFRFIVNNILLSHEQPWVQIPHWHQQIPVEITFEATFKLSQILEECGLAEDSIISCGISATSNKTKKKLVSELAVLESGQTVVNLSFDGRLTGGDLKIEAFLTVSKAVPIQGMEQTAPDAWAILWTDQTLCHLEGNQARAEIHPADFTKSDHKRTLWKIHEDYPTAADAWLTCELNNAINVEYNEKQSAFIADTLGIQLLAAAYAESIISAAVETDGVLELMFDDSVSLEQRGSLLRTSQLLINNVIGYAAPELVRSSWHRSRANYIAKIQHMTGGQQ